MIIKFNNEVKERIDVFLSESTHMSRSLIKKQIKEENILVNNNVIKPNYKLSLGDEIIVPEITEEIPDIQGEDIALNIKYEDEYLLVIDKPSNMVVHPAPGNYSGTLVNALIHYSKNLSDINGEFRPGIVHRIDKDTSGLLIVAKTNEAHQKLSEMIKDREIKREYKAIVHGEIPEKEAKIIAPIGRDQNDRKRMCVTDKNSKDATTLLTLLDSNQNYSLIKCSLLTGRTHQIRVHLKYINHPVLGDPKYGPRKTIDTIGQALHAYRLEFNHPITDEKIVVMSELPQEFVNSLEKTELKDI